LAVLGQSVGGIEHPEDTPLKYENGDVSSGRVAPGDIVSEHVVDPLF
jgi:hypothetical protein